MNIQALMKQAQSLQKDMMKAKEEIDNTLFTGSNSFVTVKVNGKKKVLDIKIDTDAMFISIGLVPQSKFLDGIVDLNDYKYISSDNSCTTSMDGVFVAGDVKDKKIRQLTTAVNDGTIAALSAIDYLDKE